MLDHWAFGMSKADGGASGPGSLASPPSGVRESNINAADKTHAVEMDQTSERIAQLLRGPNFDENSSLPSGHITICHFSPLSAGPRAQTMAVQPSANGYPPTGVTTALVPPSSGAGSPMVLDPQSGDLEAVGPITVKIAVLPGFSPCLRFSFSFEV